MTMSQIEEKCGAEKNSFGAMASSLLDWLLVLGEFAVVKLTWDTNINDWLHNIGGQWKVMIYGVVWEIVGEWGHPSKL